MIPVGGEQPTPDDRPFSYLFLFAPIDRAEEVQE